MPGMTGIREMSLLQNLTCKQQEAHRRVHALRSCCHTILKRLCRAQWKPTCHAPENP